ncbi:hypothetical protein F7725_004214 [Dissostichus mawsoni]|uniref:ELM2 domain-containing protein n=1 Tax=Dissostichus mawsoni TaxID=36200 RepID=A0A7J5XIE5_DISMA|nr:hypothetical protein F7725_004214 [Dissostichus mawsoni]
MIRRIEELNKTANGNVEAKVVCLFRRRDISGNLNTLADSNAREGKCNVTLLNETDDCFFYSLVFDPNQKTLLADQGEIRVGSKYQAEIPDKLAEGEQQLKLGIPGRKYVQSLHDPIPPETKTKFPLVSGEADTRIQEKLETKVWDTNNLLKDPQIDQFLVVARAVGTFARALDCSSSIRQPSLHMSAAAASRDITLFHAMDTLQKNSYDLAKAMSTLVPQGGPVLCRDEMEEWSASEAMLVVQFYYMWKTTDRYIQQKRLKAAEADSKLKQVYIPTYTKPNPNQIMAPGSKPGMNGAPGFQKGLSCESCHTAQSPQWYAWGPPNMQCRLCASCWIYWKKYGGLKTPTQLEGAARTGSETGPRGHMTRQEVQGLSPFTRNEGRAKLLAKNRQTFILQTTKLTRIARRVCEDILQPRRAARRPYASINANAVKAECTYNQAAQSHEDPRKDEGDPSTVPGQHREGFSHHSSSETEGVQRPPTPINRNQASTPRVGQSLLGKRGFESAAGVPYPANGRPYTSGMRTTSQSVIKRQKVSQGEAPNPVVFVATKDTRALRKHLTQSEMRRAARKPHLMVRIKLPPPPRSLVMPLLPSSTSEPIVLED